MRHSPGLLVLFAGCSVPLESTDRFVCLFVRLVVRSSDLLHNRRRHHPLLINTQCSQICVHIQALGGRGLIPANTIYLRIMVIYRRMLTSDLSVRCWQQQQQAAVRAPGTSIPPPSSSSSFPNWSLAATRSWNRCQKGITPDRQSSLALGASLASIADTSICSVSLLAAENHVFFLVLFFSLSSLSLSFFNFLIFYVFTFFFTFYFFQFPPLVPPSHSSFSFRATCMSVGLVGLCVCRPCPAMWTSSCT